MSIELYPAVDVLGGKAVRLEQGDFARTKVYDADPLEAARRWVEAGARRLHVVDLDGARAGRPVNLAQLERIASAVPVAVQYGGGLRSLQDAESALGCGAARIVIGTVAFIDERLLRSLVLEHGERIAVGLDVRGGRVAIQGWRDRVRVSPAGAVEKLVALGVKTIVYTKIDWDGTMRGVDLRVARDLAEAGRGTQILYSGGIGSLDDLRALAGLRLEALAGVIVGKALYEARFTVSEALAALQGETSVL
jgi:phosphoribosylformimino-5-aminoimidazole carboxamide ribotide isomerase